MILEKLRKKHVKKTLEKTASSITESSHHVTIMHITFNSKYDIKIHNFCLTTTVTADFQFCSN